LGQQQQSKSQPSDSDAAAAIGKSWPQGKSHP
jgi:hypothetical protein